MQTIKANHLVQELKTLGLDHSPIHTRDAKGKDCEEYVTVSVTQDELAVLRAHKKLFIIHEWTRMKSEGKEFGACIQAIL